MDWSADIACLVTRTAAVAIIELIQAGADINTAEPTDQMTPLMIAAKQVRWRHDARNGDRQKQAHNPQRAVLVRWIVGQREPGPPLPIPLRRRAPSGQGQVRRRYGIGQGGRRARAHWRGKGHSPSRRFAGHANRRHARPAVSRNTALHWACTRGDLNVVQLLVEFDSAVNLPEKGGWYTPFHWSGTGGLNMRPIA